MSVQAREASYRPFAGLMTRRGPHISLIVLLLLQVSLIAQAATPSQRPLTVVDGVQSVRAIASPTPDLKSVFESPDGGRFVVFLVKGDLRQDRVVMDILSGELDSIESATPTQIAQLYTRGLGYPDGAGQLAGAPLLTSALNVPTWLDNRTILFMWEDARGTLQLVSLDVITREVKFLTHETEDVVNFAAGPTGTVVYDVRPTISKAPSNALVHDGFAVTSPDALTLLSGIVDGSSIFDYTTCKRSALTPHFSGELSQAGSPIECQLSFVASPSNVTRLTIFSPDGTRMILNAPVDRVPADWALYSNADLTRLMRQKSLDPAQLESRLVSTLGILDLGGTPRFSTLGVPANAYRRLHVSWAPDAQSVLLWPTFLPLGRGDGAGNRGNAVAQYDLHAGELYELPLPSDAESRVSEIHLLSQSRAEIDLNDNQTLLYSRDRALWRMTRVQRAPPAQRHVNPPTRAKVRVELRESMTASPALYAVDVNAHRERLLLQLNPQFDTDIRLARVESVEWNGPYGKKIVGRLYYPLDYVAGERYPVVIQAHSAGGRGEFSIYGPARQYGIGSGPGWSVFLAQALAAKGIAVLETSGLSPGDNPTSELVRLQRQSAGIESGAQYVIKAGIGKANAVGLMGYSVAGRMVEYALIHSMFPYAAAIVSDAADGNYIQAALLGWPESRDDMNGGPPFGSGLKDWLVNSPAFNVERISVPLQIEVTSSGENFSSVLLEGWEMFSRLRHLRKAVELYVIPDIFHGSHILQNPRQLVALQTRALDWWCFWLKGEMRPGREAATEYELWKHLKSLQTMAHPGSEIRH